MQVSSRQQFFHRKVHSKQLTVQTTSYKKNRDIPPSAAVATIQLSPVCKKLIVCNHKQVQYIIQNVEMMILLKFLVCPQTGLCHKHPFKNIPVT